MLNAAAMEPRTKRSYTPEAASGAHSWVAELHTQFHNHTSHGTSFSTLYRDHSGVETSTDPQRPGPNPSHDWEQVPNPCASDSSSQVGHHGLLVVLTIDRRIREPWRKVHPCKRQLSWAMSPRSLSRTRKEDPMTSPQDLSQGQSGSISFLKKIPPPPSSRLPSGLYDLDTRPPCPPWLLCRTGPCRAGSTRAW